jgi:predicted RNase H-like HicB family nuclease
MSKNYRIEIVKDEVEGGYAAQYPELKGCITCAEDINKLFTNLEDAKRAWLAAALEDEYPIPEPDSDERYSGQFKLRIPKALHRKLAYESKREGVSMNQYCLYLLSKNSGEKAFKSG